MLYNVQQVLEKLSPYLQEVDCKVGKFVIYKNDTIVSQSIRLFGEYCHAEIDIMSRYLTSDSLYIDVGTNIGYHALGIHKSVGCSVLGFEPHPYHFAVAAYNCDKNPIKLYNCALSSKKKDLKFSNFDPANIGNYGELSINDKGFKVSSLTLDVIEDITKCTLIKIDVEGHELDVLKGGNRVIEKFKPVIFYETMDKDKWMKSYNFLTKLGYKQYWVAVRTCPVKPTFIKSDINPFDKNGVLNILAVPIEYEQPTDLIPVIANEHYKITAERIVNYKIHF